MQLEINERQRRFDSLAVLLLVWLSCFSFSVCSDVPSCCFGTLEQLSDFGLRASSGTRCFIERL
jgi:hypothetical protein